MMTKRQVGWRKLLVILTVLPCCRSLEVYIPDSQYTVASGSDVTLTCSFTPARKDFTTIIVKWDADPDNLDNPMESVATFFMNNPVDIAPAYEGRASLTVDLNTHVSTLTLTKVTVIDSRRFQCSVLIPNDDEGTTAASTSLLVLVPPSKPICSLQGKAEYWHDISLTCRSEEGSPKPVYEWKSLSVKNVPRQFPPKTTEKEGVLSLFNISREMSGFYVCTSTNQVGSNSCNFTLAVVPASMNEASIGGIVGGVLAGLLLLAIIVFCCCRKKGKKDEYAEGEPGEMEFYDAEAPEAGETYLDNKSRSETKQHKPSEDNDAAPLNNRIVVTTGLKMEDDQRSHSSSKVTDVGKGSDIDSQRYRDDQRDQYRGSRDRLDDPHDRYVGSRDRLDENAKYHSGSRDRLDEQRDRSRGSRDRLDDQYRGSRDRLDEQRDRSRGSRDRLDDQRDQYRSSRDRLDDQRDQRRGSRDQLHDQRDQHRGHDEY